MNKKEGLIFIRTNDHIDYWHVSVFTTVFLFFSVFKIPIPILLTAHLLIYIALGFRLSSYISHYKCYRMWFVTQSLIYIFNLFVTQLTIHRPSCQLYGLVQSLLIAV